MQAEGRLAGIIELSGMLDPLLEEMIARRLILAHGGAQEAWIVSAEEALGVPFPLSMRMFLCRYNTVEIANHLIFEVNKNFHYGLVAQTRFWREVAEPGNMIVIGRLAIGIPCILLPDQVDEFGEYPVALLDVRTRLPGDIIASSYQHFLWFALNDLHRALAHREHDAQNPPAEWPFYRHPCWRLRHDPALAHWYGHDCPSATPGEWLPLRPHAEHRFTTALVANSLLFTPEEDAIIAVCQEGIDRFEYGEWYSSYHRHGSTPLFWLGHARSGRADANLS